MNAGSHQLRLLGTKPLKQRARFVGVCVLVAALFAWQSDYNLATGTGNLSMVLFLAANTYFPVKRVRIRYQVRDVQGFFDKFLVYHIWLNTASFGVGCIHCYFNPWTNNWLRLVLVLMGLLTVGGFLMWMKYPPARVKKGLYILHTQQFLFFLMVFALLKGHYVF
jgi:hypothetical protein